MAKAKTENKIIHFAFKSMFRANSKPNYKDACNYYHATYSESDIEIVSTWRADACDFLEEHLKNSKAERIESHIETLKLLIERRGLEMKRLREKIKNLEAQNSQDEQRIIAYQADLLKEKERDKLH